MDPLSHMAETPQRNFAVRRNGAKELTKRYQKSNETIALTVACQAKRGEKKRKTDEHAPGIV
jgi:hypothetical protein